MSDPLGLATRGASRWVPPAVWASFILVLTSWPVPELPPTTTGWDKVAHVLMYGVLGVLVSRAMRAPRALLGIATAAVAISIFGAVDEWHQLFIPGRDASAGDWLADSIGAVSGLVTAHLHLRGAPMRPGPST